MRVLQQEACNMANMISSFFHPEEGYKKAGQQLNKYWDKSNQFYNQGQGYLQPYNQQGQSQYQRLMDQANALNDPAALQAKWSQGYEKSPQAIQLQKEATSGGMDAASSMGLLGSSTALNNIQQSSSNIMQGDRQNYMNDLMNKYLQSIGIGQGIYGTGANAAGAMSGNAMNQGGRAMDMGQNMAQMMYGQTNAPGDMFGKLAGHAIDAGVNYATGGVSGAAKAAAKAADQKEA